MVKKESVRKRLDEVGNVIRESVRKIDTALEKIEEADHGAADFRRKIEETKRLAEEAHIASMTDALTGIRNRRAFNTEIQRHFRHVTEAKKAPDPRLPTVLSLAFIDIDKFKAINDTHGHPV